MNRLMRIVEHLFQLSIGLAAAKKIFFIGILVFAEICCGFNFL